MLTPTRTFLERDVGDEYLVFDRDHDRLHVLNATAREVYLLCVEHGDVGTVVNVMEERYSVEPERLREDVRDAVRRFVELGLLRDNGTSPASGNAVS